LKDPVSKEEKKPKKTGRKQEEPEPKPKGQRSFLLVLIAIVLAGFAAVLLASGWLHAQSARWPAVTPLADRLASLLPGGLRAPGYKGARNSRNEAVRDKASDALDALGPEAGDALRKQLESLKSRQAEVRRQALEALARMRDKARAAVPQIAESLRDENARVRAKAAEALGRIRAKVDTAIPALKQALKDKAPEVREAARKALEKLQDKAPGPDDKDGEPER